VFNRKNRIQENYRKACFNQKLERTNCRFDETIWKKGAGAVKENMA
jgi:hypothetical protein